MNKCLVLLVVALAILIGGDAVVASAALPNIETSKLSPSNVGDAVQTDSGGRRSLRGLALIGDATNEERGMKELLNKFKAWATTSKLGLKYLAWSAQRGSEEVKAVKKMKLAKLLVDKNADYKTLYKSKISSKEYYDALGLHPRLVNVGRTDIFYRNNPDFKKWEGYMDFWNAQVRKKAL
ncbi:hypothetical protein PR003_g20830 [Phytophthora rubi]|uniref:RxLR effector protein n=1 Tax=Phytophthora rubi TaxID=129364 RepID=A0A6A3JN18_9STRA|nr:hypothetical protein PR002_g22621 [Phytophthora rubi]KAE8996636.1 hypothetical protein PR001_g19799 [Phytophthora rubi]KAE9308083.1 hypothetical protein PR003_g20830 [Phytophthora rubi]